MIKKAQKEELCQISLTGARSLILLGLLIQEPRSLEDIRREFIQINLMSGENSDDILRIDINTLRNIGCKISRADHRTNNKYVLENHPFKIKLTQEEVNVLKCAFNKIKEDASLSILMKYDELFKKIVPHILDNELKEQIAGISPLKTYSSDILNELLNACQNKKVLKLVYQTPLASSSSEKNIIVENVKLKNDKLYLDGIDKDVQKPVSLKIKRILKILSQSENDSNIKSQPIIIRFRLKEFGISGLEDCESIVSGDIEEGFIIEGHYHNMFWATQRILSLGSNCIVLEPEDFKEHIIEVLKKMRDIYNG